MSGWRFCLVWMLTFLGFPVGGELALLLVCSIDGAANGALGGAEAGVAIGVAQWLVLRGCLGMTTLWIAPPPPSGWGPGWRRRRRSDRRGDDHRRSPRHRGGVSGVAVGLPQGALLGERVRAPSAWPLVMALAWPLGWTVAWAVGVDVERVYAVFGSTGALVFAAITGVGILLILRGQDR